jgi:hypothetical protein
MRCGYYTYRGEKYWIPGCYGGIYGDDGGCYCYKPKVTEMRKYETKKDQNEQLQDECRKLKHLLEQSQKKLHKAELRIRELERQGLPLHLRRRLNEPAYLKVFIDKITYNHG